MQPILSILPTLQPFVSVAGWLGEYWTFETLEITSCARFSPRKVKKHLRKVGKPFQKVGQHLQESWFSRFRFAHTPYMKSRFILANWDRLFDISSSGAFLFSGWLSLAAQHFFVRSKPVLFFNDSVLEGFM
ncbi:hypothetical protein B0T25DRAFT_161552 [Lasiosphaeria hispida]|uniref:Uncharacterized protein n=1 Tax=Lasiosphaeria hispida TaxID=260671 RepID=A0AAJ0MG90_9PEZI|nr:hypothetical protein B0T25DRAFT_161552 [Lasiosphaeria hispida]